MTTIYSLTRDLSGDRELIHLSTDRKHLADLMRVDFDKWTVPVTYTIEITYAFDSLFQEGRAEALLEAVNFLKGRSRNFPYGQIDAILFRMAARDIEDLQP